MSASNINTHIIQGEWRGGAVEEYMPHLHIVNTWMINPTMTIWYVTYNDKVNVFGIQCHQCNEPSSPFWNHRFLFWSLNDMWWCFADRRQVTSCYHQCPHGAAPCWCLLHCAVSSLHRWRDHNCASDCLIITLPGHLAPRSEDCKPATITETYWQWWRGSRWHRSSIVAMSPHLAACCLAPAQVISE